MSGEDKREALRDHLKSGYKKINLLNAKTRKVKAAQGFVMMKRDKIIREMEETLSNLYKGIEQMKTKFEKDLNYVVEEKIAELDSEFEEIQEDICMLMEICVESEKTLKMGNEDLLHKHSSALVSSFNMLFESDECSVVDYDQMIVMDFKANKLTELLSRKGLGYIVTSEGEQYPPPSDNLVDVATQVNGVVKHTDATTQTFTMNFNQNIIRPPLIQNPYTYINPNSMYMARQNYTPYIPAGGNYYTGQSMMSPLNHPLNMNSSNLGRNRMMKPTFPLPMYCPPVPAQTEKLQPTEVEVNPTFPLPDQTEKLQQTEIKTNNIPVTRDYMADIQKLSSGDRYRPLFSTDLSNGNFTSPSKQTEAFRPTADSQRERCPSTSSTTSNHSITTDVVKPKATKEEKALSQYEESRSKRPPRLPGAKTVDRLMNSGVVTGKVKLPPSSSSLIEEDKKCIKSRAFSVRFSPTSISCSMPETGDNPANSSSADSLSQNIQELKDLQSSCPEPISTSTPFSCSNINNNAVVPKHTRYDSANCDSKPVVLNLADASKTITFNGECDANQNIVKSIKSEVNSPPCFNDKHSQISDINLPNKGANESWDEELVSINEEMVSVKIENISKSPITVNYSNNSDQHMDKSRFISGNDSGISQDIHSTGTSNPGEAWDQEIEMGKSNTEDFNKAFNLEDITPSKPKENKGFGSSRSQICVKSETGPSKSINLMQFKSLFEKHIESNDSVPKSGHNVGNGASYHVDCSEKAKSETSLWKPRDEKKTTPQPSTNFCIYTQHKNSKEITASLLYKMGQPGQGASFTDILNFPIGVTVNSKKHIIVNDTSNHVVKIFRQDSLISVMGLGDVQMQRPSAVVVNKTDDVFVKDNCAIHVFDSNGKFKYTFGKDKLKQPYGLVMTEDETLLVLDIQRPLPCLYEFHQDGKMVACYPYQPLAQSQPMSKCRFMAYYAGNLLVSDLGRSTMYLTNRKGELITQFSRYGRAGGEFNEPSGVTVDSDGHWIVADSKNHRLQVFKSNGDFLSVIKFKEPIIRPSDIHLTEDGTLIVTDFLAHMVKVFTLEKS
ncbi:hypothetical protein SNE40_007951 [Patella caerulea]|uniref:Uncharacterized protein n=1 Tax=Patella caerulea TaxID=87958 RepID=A0AAN8Q328_PATCE